MAGSSMISRNHVIAALLFMGIAGVSTGQFAKAEDTVVSTVAPVIASVQSRGAFDPTQRASTLLLDSQQTTKSKELQESIKTTFPERIVKSQKRHSDKVLIMNAGEAVPM